MWVHRMVHSAMVLWMLDAGAPYYAGGDDEGVHVCDLALVRGVCAASGHVRSYQQREEKERRKGKKKRRAR